MAAPLALLFLAFVVAVLTPRLVGSACWPRRAPRAGILLWQAAVFCVLASCMLLALTALLPVHGVSFDVGHFLHACPELLRSPYTFASDSWLHLGSLLVAVGTVLMLLRALALRGLAVRRGRARQRLLLDLLAGQRDVQYGAHIIDHDIALAYCVPGGGGRVVVTSAALEALNDRQLTAVLAHEHAHLDGRHDLVLFGADVAATAFPWSQFFRTSRREIARLVELLADDEATRRSDRASLASALVDLGQGESPEGTVGAAGDTVLRVERLVQHAPDLSRGRRAVVLATSLLLLVAPWIIAVAPAWVARTGRCAHGAA